MASHIRHPGCSLSVVNIAEAVASSKRLDLGRTCKCCVYSADIGQVICDLHGCCMLLQFIEVFILVDQADIPAQGSLVCERLRLSLTPASFMRTCACDRGSADDYGSVTSSPGAVLYGGPIFRRLFFFFWRPFFFFGALLF